MQILPIDFLMQFLLQAVAPALIGGCELFVAGERQVDIVIRQTYAILYSVHSSLRMNVMVLRFRVLHTCSRLVLCALAL